MIHKYIKMDGLVKARMVSLTLSGAFAAVCGGFAIKALVDLAMNRREIAALLPGGYIHAADLVGSASAMTGSSIVGVGVSFFAMGLVYFEQRGAVSNKLRWFTEGCLAVATTAMVAATIATTYICLTRSAVPSAPGMTTAVLTNLIEKVKHRSLKYRDTMGFYTMVTGWPCAFFLCTDLILLIMSGLRYRRQARERAHQSRHQANNSETYDGEKPPYSSSAHVERL